MVDPVMFAIARPQASRCSWRSLATIFILPALLSVSFSQTSRTGQTSTPTAVTLRVIVVSSEAEAQQILDRLKKGEDFGIIARNKSIDPNAEDYGYLGRVETATLRRELREAVRGVAPGQITGVIKVPGGYAILKVLPDSEGSVGQGMSANRDLPLSAKGSIEYPADVAGQMIADLAFQKYPKPPGWEQDLREICQVRKQSLSTLESRLKNRLYPATPKMSLAEKPIDSIQAHYALAQVEAYQGNMDKAVAEWEAAYQLAITSVPAGAPQLEAVLGVAYLHKSEMENGVYRDPDDKCIFPPRAGIKKGTVPVDLSSAYNVKGIYTDGSKFAPAASLDGGGFSYSKETLGSTQLWDGVSFHLGPANAPDAVESKTVTLPEGKFASLKILATGVEGSQESQVFTITYADGTSSPVTQSLSDWYISSGYQGESEAVAAPYRIVSDGSKDLGTFHVYGYSFDLDSTKIVRSITLPDSEHVLVLAMTLVPSAGA